MKYKITARLVDGRKTIGYQLKSQDMHIINIGKPQVIELAKHKLLLNAIYKGNGILAGLGGVDLRKLPILHKNELGEAKKNIIESVEKSNHQKLKAYMEKQRMLGKEILDFKGYLDDRVTLVKSSDYSNTGRIVIPSFVTDIGLRNFSINFSIGPLYRCRYTEVFVDNKPGVSMSVKGLCSGMESARLKAVFRHPECIFDISEMFSGCSNLEELDVSNLNTSNVTGMGLMFKGCNKLRSLNIKHFDTSNVKYMQEMFLGCSSLRSLDISNFNTCNVRSMLYMFSGCENLEELNLGRFDTRKVVNMASMFSHCTMLKELDVSSFNMEMVEDTSGMFALCENLVSLDLSHFSMKSVNDIAMMFAGCKNLKSIGTDKITVNNGTDTSKALYKSGLTGKIIIETTE